MLTDVYYILRLQSNIISVGQLDELDCRTVIHRGVVTVEDPPEQNSGKSE